MPCAVIGCNDTPTEKLIVKVSDKEINLEVCGNCADMVENSVDIHWKLV